MSKFKIVVMMVLIAFAMGIVLVGDAAAAERGKLAFRQVLYISPIHTLKVPDVEGHTNVLYEAKGIDFYDKWGAALFDHINNLDLIKGAGTLRGYIHTTFPDGSTITLKFEGKSTGGGIGLTGVGSVEGTRTYTKGTGKFEGIQGRGTFTPHILGQGWAYWDLEGEYTLP